MSLSRDFVEFVECLNDARVEYLLVGGHALAFHGWPRFTKDIDFWVRPSRPNARRILGALAAFGFAEIGVVEADLEVPGKVIQLGVPPNRIDLVTSVDGVEFAPAWQRRVESTYQGKPLHVIHLKDLIANKLATGREQDRLDAEQLRAAASPSRPRPERKKKR